jgi:outer membrane protein assembly complex protein YaeT
MSPAVRLSTFLALVLVALTAAGCHEDQGSIEVVDLAFEGVSAVPAGRLKKILATHESAILPWGEKRFFSRARFDADLKRIEAFYADRGYPNARVTGTDIRLDEQQKKVRLTIRISEGAPIRVEQVLFDGFEPLPSSHFQELQAQAAIKAGQPRDRQLVQATRDLAASELKDHGYPYAAVEAFETPGSQPYAVKLRFAATPGPLAYFGSVEISGNSSISDGAVRRHLSYKPGDLFRVSQLQDSQRKLYGLEVFDFVNIEALGTEQRISEIATRVTVTEGKHRRAEFGVGYGSEERARVDARWRHVNFFGGARTAGAHGRWSSLDRGVRLDFHQPYLFRRNYSASLNGQTWFSNEPAYTLDTFGGRGTIERRIVRRDPLTREYSNTSIGVSLIHEYERYAISPEALADLTFRDELIALGLDPTRGGVGSGTLDGLALDLQRSTTANLLDARTGYVASLHLEQAGRWLPGSFDYFEVRGEGRHYLTLFEKLVWANKVQFGSIDGPAEFSVPFFKRYFLGGSTNLRGWGRFDVAPLSGAGLPIGGHSQFQATTELRAPVWRNLGAVIFIDAGNVWSRPWGFDFGDMRYDAGPGLRYITPIGPVRFDLGYQLTPIDGLLVNGKPERRRWRVHFSIGQAF